MKDIQLDEIHERLFSAIQSSGLSYGELSKITGIPKSAIQRYATGETIKIPMDRLHALAIATNTSDAQLMGWQNSSEPSIFSKYPEVLPVTIHRVPILGGAACGEPLYAPGDGTEYATTDGDISCDFALVAHGDSMTGDRIHDGDIVFFKKQDDVEDGQIAAVSIDDGVSIKRVSRIRMPNGDVAFTQLLSSNPAYAAINIGGPDEVREVHIIGKAIAFKGRLNQ